MENLYGSAGNTSSSRTPKLKSLNGTVSPLNLSSHNFIGRGIYQNHYHHHLHRSSKSPIFDPYASSDSGSTSPNVDSPLMRYLLPSSGGGGFLSPLPLAAIENFEIPPSSLSTVYHTPVKVEEDVLVMDGILVDSSNSKTPKGGGVVRMRSPLSLSDYVPSSLPSSEGSENGLYKTEKCRSWEDSNACRFGSKCQVNLSILLTIVMIIRLLLILQRYFYG